MIQTVHQTPMKISKNKKTKKSNKITIKNVSLKPLSKIKKKVKPVVKEPKIKEKKPKLFSKSEICVPRTVESVASEKDLSDEVTDESLLDGPKKKRRGRNKKDKIYFSKATEEAIVAYNKSENMVERNHIYETRIKFSFEKLVENIFNTFKFTYFDNSPLEIQKETVTHLVSNIQKFESGKGKAFSYFSIIAKNYLIFHNNNNYKRFNQHVDISEQPSESSVCLQTEDVHHKQKETNEFMKLMIDYWEKNVNKIFSKQRDLSIANAVIELFRNSDRLDDFNKKTLYLYIREISNCKTQQITKVINKMKSYQNVVLQSYRDRGNI